MGICCDMLCKCLRCCCFWRHKEEDHKPLTVSTKSKKSMKKVTDYSSPSQMDVKDLTTVHSVPDVSPRVLNRLLKEKGYKLEDKIGSGTYATVFKAKVLVESQLENQHLKANEIIACKVVDISQTNDSKDKDSAKRMEEVKNELFVLEKIKHPNIIQMYDHFIVDKHYLYIFMEYASGGDLSKHLELFGPFIEDECRVWFEQILTGVSYLHQQKIAHRDLKLQNILLDGHKKAFISDFGLSQVSSRSDRPGRKGGVQWSRSYCGTYPYMSPEIIKSYARPVYYDPFVADIWALGVILFLLFNKNYPFNPQSKRFLESMLSRSMNWNSYQTPSTGLKQLLNSIFEPDPDLRIRIKHLSQHYWVLNTKPNVLPTDPLTTETETLNDSTA